MKFVIIALSLVAVACATEHLTKEQMETFKAAIDDVYKAAKPYNGFFTEPSDVFTPKAEAYLFKNIPIGLRKVSKFLTAASKLKQEELESYGHVARN